MTNKNDSKFVKNPLRQSGKTVLPSSYTPEYQRLGLEPSKVNIGATRVLNPQTNEYTISAPRIVANPRLRTPEPVDKNVPYAEITPSAGIGSGPMLNVGNNMETSWSTLDDLVVNDLDDTTAQSSKLDPTHPMIDNNDLVDLPGEDVPRHAAKIDNTPDDGVLETTFTSVDAKAQSDDDEYFLMIKGTIIANGSLSSVQEEVRALVFGEHLVYKAELEDIAVLKKVKIKVGVFLEG